MRRAPALGLLAVLGLASLLGGSVPGDAQGACAQTDFDLALDRNAATLGPGETATFVLTIANGNAAFRASVTFAFSQPDAAEWSRSPAGGTMTVDAGQAQSMQLALTAPQSVNGPRSARVQVSAAVSCQDPLLGAQPTACCTLPATVSATMNVTQAPIRTVATGSTVGLEVFAFLGLLGLVAAGAGYALLSSRTGIVLSSPEPRRDMRPGKGASFPVLVRNRSDAKQTVLLEIAAPPPGWMALMAIQEVPLAPNEERSLWLNVRSAPESRPGDHAEIEVLARVKENPRITERIRLEAFVVSEEEDEDAET